MLQHSFQNSRFHKLFPKLYSFMNYRTKRMASTLVETKRDGKVFLIAINRPSHRNSVNLETGRQLLDAFKQFESNDEVSVAVFYGKGNFCAGYDLKELASWDTTNQKSSIPYAPMGPSKTVFKKPIIAAISGYAVAGGLELALMCDLRVAEDDVTLGVFCRRFGVPLIDGGTVRLPHIIGLSRALDLILSGRAVKADEALAMGLVNRVVSKGNALKTAVELANEIASFPQECMLADRRSCMYAMYDMQTLEGAMQFEHNNGKIQASREAQIKNVVSKNECKQFSTISVGKGIIHQESIEGAGKFVKGSGRNGSFSDWKSKL
ncbi:short-chain-enoyl-CoA hydratase-like isoform X2 [Antedon mediterranea]|uniref:short-chain-enoyl-CoA hydratase-like isoform X2 n=1 Tax=Antedon mediterranea TaxID=105859 RepID=UPI003AF6AD39